jgi:hypothetical protein
MKYGAKMNRYEKKQYRQAKYAQDMAGTGLFVFENNTDADLSLPRPTATGLRMIGPRKRFQGDSYYLKLVGSPMNLLRLIEELKPKDGPATVLSEEKNMNDILILDQPDQITTSGKVEHFVDNKVPSKPLNDANQNKQMPEILINENPLDCVEIIKG